MPMTAGLPLPAPTLSPAMSFDEATDSVLAYLRRRWPWGSWSLGRVADGAQTHLYVVPNDVGIEQGLVVPWEDTICVRMVAGEGPHVAPDVGAVESYAAAVAALDLASPIGAYAGMPVTEADGALFGVLCGLSSTPVVDGEPVDEDLLGLLAALLGMVLAADRAREQLAHQVRTARLQAQTDVMTGLSNRRAWDELLVAEEAAHAKFGDPAAVVLVDLDQLKAINDTHGHAAGDAYIAQAGRVLRASVGAQHPVARLGGDEFGILLRATGTDGAVAVVDALYADFAAAGVAGSIGWAPYTVITGFPGALAEADSAMYAAKRRRRAQRQPA